MLQHISLNAMMIPNKVSLKMSFLAMAGFSSQPAPVWIPSAPPSIHQTPKGGTPMGTPPSAKGVTAQLPFVDEQFEGAELTTHPLQAPCKPFSCVVNGSTPCNDVLQFVVHLA